MILHGISVQMKPIYTLVPLVITKSTLDEIAIHIRFDTLTLNQIKHF